MKENLYKELLKLAYHDYIYNLNRTGDSILADLMDSYKKLQEDGEK